MGVRSNSLLTGFWVSVGLVASSALLASSAIAQIPADESRDRETLQRQQTLQSEFEDAYFGLSGTYWRNRQIPNNLTWIIGPFPEANISLDAQDVHEVYANALSYQGTSDPTIRTADLANPFGTSLMFLPSYQEATPGQFPAGFNRPVLVPSIPAAPPAPPAGPVRGLY
ncbi:hypothetical protein ACQ4M4_13985 [Leptolyngbya sp. AN02str]|uniref:hypothetical protein n=1 Tax=Leptolyngbya sp. AN02str TaxID=3423363 RepID=UPI003D31886E